MNESNKGKIMKMSSNAMAAFEQGLAACSLGAVDVCRQFRHIPTKFSCYCRRGFPQ